MCLPTLFSWRKSLAPKDLIDPLYPAEVPEPSKDLAPLRTSEPANPGKKST